MENNYTCAGCVYLHKMADVKNAVSNTICKRFPPTVNLVMVQGMAGPQPAGICMYPSVAETSPACGEYKLDKKLYREVDPSAPR